MRTARPLGPTPDGRHLVVATGDGEASLPTRARVQRCGATAAGSDDWRSTWTVH